ncbi:NAD(P)-binding protein [Amniculicola lignicola CBS 123094]|uniref:NAD(P)-binding protein n=1 Tax=Amniculicola lignicola CBS 123094 TaxID=1392246 RepID=A0A6A5WVQ5_9PLEO|nr:NAD(P)-binding protein [Amniculicola lignicola CBS 123094]
MTVPKYDTAGDDWEFTFAVNTKGVFNCLRAELKIVSTGGIIVSAASVFGQFGAVVNTAYCASKAVVIGLSRTTAKENQSTGVNCVSPGSVNTPMSQGEDPEDVACGLQVSAQKRPVEPVEAVQVIVFLLSDAASFVTGAVYNVDGGWLRPKQGIPDQFHSPYYRPITAVTLSHNSSETQIMVRQSGALKYQTSWPLVSIDIILVRTREPVYMCYVNDLAEL